MTDISRGISPDPIQALENLFQSENAKKPVAVAVHPVEVAS